MSVLTASCTLEGLLFYIQQVPNSKVLLPCDLALIRMQLLLLTASGRLCGHVLSGVRLPLDAS